MFTPPHHQNIPKLCQIDHPSPTLGQCASGFAPKSCSPSPGDPSELDQSAFRSVRRGELLKGALDGVGSNR